jgi:hypothetical protein
VIRYSRGRGIHDNKPRQLSAPDFAAFVAAIDRHRAPRKAGAGYFAGPLNGDGTRRAEGAEPRGFLAVDLDRIAADLLPEVRVHFARFSGAAWPTHSSAPKAPRERVILELSREATRAECLRLGDVLMRDLRDAFGDALKVDPATFRAEQPIFDPPTGATIARFFGEPIPVDAWLANAPEAEPERAEARAACGRKVTEGRNEHLSREAFRLRKLGLTVDELAAVLQLRNLADCDPPLPEAEVRGIAARKRIVAPDAAPREPAPPVNILADFAAPPLDAGDFPPVLRDYAELLARAVGHDVSAYLAAMLGAVAGMLDDGIRLCLDERTEWYESPRAWVLLIGPPGAAKSPGIKGATDPLVELHTQLRDRWHADCAALAEGETRPPMPALFVSDATIEALGDTLAANPRGLLYLSHELDSWLGSHDAYRDGQGSRDRGHWLALYDGGPHEVQRVQRGTQLVPNWSASLLTATTPAGLQRHARSLPADGLIQRFLPVLVRPMRAPDLTVTAAEVGAARTAYAARLRELFDWRPSHPVRMTAEAAELFRARLAELREQVPAMAEVNAAFAAHLAKHPGMIGRLALILHAAGCDRHPAERGVRADTMAAAIRLARRIGRSAASLYAALGGVDTVATVARAVARAILADRLPEFTRNDLMQACRPFRDAPEFARDGALRLLEDAAWVAPVEGARRWGGRVSTYAVEPRAHELYGQHGEAHRARRAKVRAALLGEGEP